MGISLQSFGAAGEVTGSKHLLTFADRKLLLDCGMFQGRRAEAQAKNQTLPFDAAALDSVILSHGHFDHSGNLPSLIKNGYEGNIYATGATRDIANLIMMDAAHIMAKDYEYMRKKHSDKQIFEPVYEERDVLATLDHFVTLNYHRRFPVMDGVSCAFHDAGHILGSSIVVLDVKTEAGERRIAFTGDLGRPGMPIIRDPDAIPPPDYLICEGTYGDRLHDPIEDAKRELGEVVRDTVKQGGKVIIPAFAVGRTQELVYYLHLLRDDNKIPEVEIFVDSPMAVNATGIFRVHQECYNDSVRTAFIAHHNNPFGFEKLRYITDLADSKKLNNRKEPCIIISSSGMCEAGRILHHLKNNIGDPRNTVLIVGFMAANTLGRALAERRPVVKIFGNEHPLKARVKILNTFSAHADYKDIGEWVGKLDLERLKRVFLVHGEDRALQNMKKVLLELGVRAVDVVEAGQPYDLDA